MEGADAIVENLDKKEFIELLKKMLCLDQEGRTTPSEALSHPFITFSHLIDYAHTHRLAYATQTTDGL